MQIDITVGLIGKICSGKSTIAQKLSNRFNIQVVSFGGYLAKFSKQHGLSVDRKSLQDLGNKFIQEDSNLFLKDVINSLPEAPHSILVEGIRHVLVYNELRKISAKSIFAFIDAPIIERYNRYCSRQKESDQVVSFEKFEAIDSHIVESEIPLLKNYCQVVVDTVNMNDENIFEIFSNAIND